MQIADKIDSWLSRNNEAKILEDGYGRSLSVPLPNHSASKTPWILVEIQQEWMESKLFGEVQTCWLSSDYRFWWWQKHNFLFFDSLQPRLTLPSGWTNSRESCDQNEFSNHSPLHFPIFRSHARKSYHRISQRSETTAHRRRRGHRFWGSRQACHGDCMRFLRLPNGPFRTGFRAAGAPKNVRPSVTTVYWLVKNRIRIMDYGNPQDTKGSISPLYSSYAGV